MEEKYMVNDILENSKHEIKCYTESLLESSNIELRQNIQSIRNTCESFHYELFKLASSKGYYIQNEIAKPEEINKIKKQVSNS